MKTMKKILPACLALVMLCGCSSNTKSEEDSSSKKEVTTSNVEAKDLTTVTASIKQEGFEDSVLPGTTAEYKVDSEGVVHSFTLHLVTAAAPIDEDEYAKKVQEDESNGWNEYFLAEDKIDEWKKTIEKQNTAKTEGFTSNYTVKNAIENQDTSLMYTGYSKAYEAVHDMTYTASKADKKSNEKMESILGIELSDNKLKENVLKDYLSLYWLEYSNEK